jgi:hypothetical protein
MKGERNMKTTKPEGIWVYTKAAENYAKDRGLEERKEGTPAMLAGKPIGDTAPTKWVTSGYVM